MGLFSLHETCFICNNDTGFNKHKTKHGYICGNCLKKLTDKKILITLIKNHTIDELKELVNTKHTYGAFSRNKKTPNAATQHFGEKPSANLPQKDTSNCASGKRKSGCALWATIIVIFILALGSCNKDKQDNTKPKEASEYTT